MSNLRQKDAMVCVRTNCQLIYPGPDKVCPGCGYEGVPYREVEALANSAPCKYCLQPIDPRGMLSHLHFKHARCIRHEFAMNPMVQLMRLMWDGELPYFTQKQLPAPNPLTVYSTRPLGLMAAPLPWMRRPKGYTPPQGYAQPWQQTSRIIGRLWA